MIIITARNIPSAVYVKGTGAGGEGNSPTSRDDQRQEIEILNSARKIKNSEKFRQKSVKQHSSEIARKKERASRHLCLKASPLVAEAGFEPRRRKLRITRARAL